MTTFRKSKPGEDPTDDTLWERGTPLRVGLVGYGLGGSTFHAPLVTATPGLELVAIATSNAERVAKATSTPEGVERLRRMTARWPFFDDLLGKIEMVCAKTDLEIARTYVRQLGGDLALLGRLEEEFHKTTDAVLRIRNTEHLLRDTPVLQSAIGLRNPYVDPLSLLQIALLERKRRAESNGEDHHVIDDILATTLSGIAQGLRNTG